MHDKEIERVVLYVQRAQTKAERRKLLEEKHREQRTQREKEYKERSLYIKNFRKETTDDDLIRMFSPFGTIQSAKVMTDNGKSKGFGFVCFSTVKEASSALNAMNGFVLSKKPLYVNIAQSREERRRILRRLRNAISFQAASFAGQPYIYAHSLPVSPSAQSVEQTSVSQKLSEDKSWRVRYQIAEILCEVSHSFNSEVTSKELIPMFTQLLQDMEPEVRSAAAKKISLFCQNLEKSDIIEHVLPCVVELSTDNSQFVRASLASVVMELTSKIGKQETITHLLPVTLSLQKDDFAEVRLSVIRNLDQVNQVIGVESLAQSLLPSLKELSDDDNWRVRLAVIEHIPLLAKQLGPRFFQEKLGAQWMQWLEDQVASIREAGTIAVQKVAQEFGPAWAKEYLVPHVIKMIESTHYLYRITVLVTISLLAVVVDGDVVHGQMLPAIVNLSKDPVPNVRFSVARNLQRMIQEAVFEKDTVSQVVQPCLKELSKDTDADVMYFANQALSECERLLTV